MGVFKLESATFEDIEHDPAATSQAAIVVLIVAFVLAVGTGFAGLVNGQGYLPNFLSTFLGSLVGWVLISAILYFVGTTFFKGDATLGEMLRVVGFAYAPQILGVIPCLGWFIGLIWTLAALLVATRQGLDISTGKAFVTIIIAGIAYLIVTLVFATIFGGTLALISL
jgi:hypothetical protein